MVVEVVETAYGQSNVDGDYCLFVKVKVGNTTQLPILVQAARLFFDNASCPLVATRPDALLTPQGWRHFGEDDGARLELPFTLPPLYVATGHLLFEMPDMMDGLMPDLTCSMTLACDGGEEGECEVTLTAAEVKYG
jgi:hypothetical protein